MTWRNSANQRHNDEETMIELSWWQFFGVIAGSCIFGGTIGVIAMALLSCRSIADGCRELEGD
jgi:hypothetical protein